jgi:hypothetical protein
MKRHRINKIKSKAFHRILKKKNQRAEGAGKGEESGNGGVAGSDDEEAAEHASTLRVKVSEGRS